MNEETKKIEVMNKVTSQPYTAVAVGMFAKVKDTILSLRFIAASVVAVFVVLIGLLLSPSTPPTFDPTHIIYKDQSMWHQVKDFATRGPSLESVKYNTLTRTYVGKTSDGRYAYTQDNKWVVGEQQ